MACTIAGEESQRIVEAEAVDHRRLTPTTNGVLFADGHCGPFQARAPRRPAALSLILGLFPTLMRQRDRRPLSRRKTYQAKSPRPGGTTSAATTCRVPPEGKQYAQ